MPLALLRKRASYRAGVYWIAINDNAGSDDGPEEIAVYVSTLLLADLFGADPFAVAIDIQRRRRWYVVKPKKGVPT